MTFVPLAAMDEDELGAVFRFLERHEELCVQLAETVRRSVKDAYAVVWCGQAFEKTTGYIRIDGKGGAIYGVINFRNTILHCLPFADMPAADTNAERGGKRGGAETQDFETPAKDFVRAFADFFVARKPELRISCVNGSKGGSKLILAALKDARINLTPSQVNEYSLFRLTAADFLHLKEPELQNGGRIFRCRTEMNAALFDRLFDLQKRYEIEEVLPERDVFSEDVCRLHLKFVLRTQYVAAVLLLDGALAAKAGTNALGFHAAQIGGVYVKPEFRRRGYAFCALYRVLKNVFTAKNVAVLFVKNANAPAIALYRALGFEKAGDYRIAYFR
ncbi:MAG: GNAT family N-acetyltransferase [Treponema sp.]